MKRILVGLTFYFLSLISFRARADEGMWLPMLLNETVYHDMQNEGLRLSPEDIYSTNHSSMKDGVLLFGGGCTGEVISDQGLLITNFHCGRGALQSHSTIENDYLKNGFWAMNKSEELQCAGLTVTFIVRMDDVTTLILNGVTSDMSEMRRQSLIEGNAKAI